MRLILTGFLFIFSIQFCYSQKKGWDSTYYVKYKDKLIISIFQSYRNYDITLNQKLVEDSLNISEINYIAESNLVSGIEVNYDKFSFSFGWKNSSNTIKQKGDTKYRNLNFNIGGNKWILENSYRSYTGFYNKNTSRYDTSFQTTGIYDQNPLLSSQSYKTKFLYFTNANKFSFKSGYSCNYKQLKSAFSFVLSGNIYYNRVNSDSSFFLPTVRHYYDTHQSLNGLNVFAASVYGGGSVNLIFWKHFFINLTLILGPEFQWRTYNYLNTHPNQTLFYTSVSGDLRGSMGYNQKHFFMLVNFTSDFSWYNASQITYLSKYGAVNFSIGGRIPVKPGKLYKKFQETKLYKKF